MVAPVTAIVLKVGVDADGESGGTTLGSEREDFGAVSLLYSRLIRLYNITYEWGSEIT
jgi:hypothetical protein